MLGDDRKHRDKFETFHFHPQNLIFPENAGNSLHQNLSTWNKCQHQMVSTRNQPMHEKLSTRNKIRFLPSRHLFMQRFVPGRQVLVQTITRIFQKNLFEGEMKFLKIILMFSVVTNHHPFIH